MGGWRGGLWGVTFIQHTFIKPWATAASQEGPALGQAGTYSLLRGAGSGERVGTLIPPGGVRGHGERGADKREEQLFYSGVRECSLRG